MLNLTTGQFHGQTNELIQLEGLTLTDTEYTHNWVDWHYHENAYFTFILQGQVLEGNKKETYNCSAGSLLFHNWQESHYNRKPPGFTRGFHIELEADWLKTIDLDLSRVQGSLNVANPHLKVLFYEIFKVSKVKDTTANLAIQSLILNVLSRLIGDEQPVYQSQPLWVSQLKDVLHDAPLENWTLPALAQTVGIHPVHLSRSFSRYFTCSLGQYIRMLRIQRSLALLSENNQSLTEIALECGFADQSHFNRCFKEILHSKPSVYQAILSR